MYVCLHISITTNINPNRTPSPMGSSEIEIVSESSTNHNNSSQSANKVPITDVFGASAYGDFEKLRKFVEGDGVSLSEPDDNGYYALQWAALNNYAAICQYIIEHGGDVHATDNTEQTALHWTAVRSSVAAANVLLANGAHVEAVDINGYRAVHMAAQFGQTTFLNHIVAKYHADFDAPDNDGRSPLHWAAYKGFPDTIRFLLFRDANQGRQDKEGCTPLHWAALTGNAEACTVLVHAGTGQELFVKDKVGLTPSQLASNKGHRHVASLLFTAQKKHMKSSEDNIWVNKIRDMGYSPILFFAMCASIVLFINSVIFAPDLPKITALVGLWGWTAVSLAFAGLYMLYRCSRKDPGFIKPARGVNGHADPEDPLLDTDLSNSSLWNGNWSQLCPTCKIIRPVRSKHCPTCKHCVEQFDHHCPWISNCVGKKNKRDFYFLVWLGFLSSSMGAIITIQRFWEAAPLVPIGESWIHFMLAQHPGVDLFLFFDGLILLAASSLLSVLSYQIACNITTNEYINVRRYKYLQNPDGRFRNPYNHGIVKNCSDFLMNGYTDDTEIARPHL